MPLPRLHSRVLLCWLAWLGGGWPAGAQPAPRPALARPVRLPTGWATLAQVLAEASRQSGVPISYSSTRVAAARRLYLPPGPPRPLGAALRDVLGPRRVTFGLLSGQVVLWPTRQAAPPGVTALNGREAPAVTVAGGPGPAAAPPVLPESPPASAGAARFRPASVGPPTLAPAFGLGLAVGPGPTRPAEASLNKRAAGFEKAAATRHPSHRSGGSGALARTTKRPAASVRSETRPGPAAIGLAAGPGPATAATAEANSSEVLAELAPLRVPIVVPAPGLPRAVAQALVAPAGPLALRARRTGQFGLVYPLSTNGLANARTTNKFSVNALVGYAAGVGAVEIGGLANVVRDSVHGFQAAGLLNLTGAAVRGVQVAGLANVTGGAVYGVQGAGLLNVVRDDARGIQVAGLANVVGGAGRARRLPDQPTRVRRWLGLPRLLATDPLAQLPAAPSATAAGPLLQAAALANLTGTDVTGLQTAALLNTARRVRGVQFGLVNVAHHVRGVQFGLGNIADSVDGVALGLINIVRHGYLRGEVWASESLPLNAVVKLGVRRYYTVLGAAAEPFGNRVQWAAGFGIGTAGRAHGRFTLSLDAVQWTLAGSSNDVIEPVDARLLTQLRPAVAWQIEQNGHLQLVVAPTLNLAIAWRNDGQPVWDFGSNQLLLINTAGSQSLTRLWPGLHIGLRF